MRDANTMRPMEGTVSAAFCFLFAFSLSAVQLGQLEEVQEGDRPQKRSRVSCVRMDGGAPKE